MKACELEMAGRRVHSDTISHNLAIQACKELWPTATAVLETMRMVSADLFSSSEGISGALNASM